jgi:16S rRNA C967 or C1407 C5-methylase (RsmB/RsmF family)
MDSTTAALWRMNSLKAFLRVSIPAILFAAAASAPAAQLSTDARTAIPHDVQQLVVIDYHAMENSTSAMDLRERVMPPELKRFEDALHKSGLNENHDVEQLAFALFRPKRMANKLDTVGIAQGQFSVQDIVANFRKQKLRATGALQQGLSAGQDRHGGLLR